MDCLIDYIGIMSCGSTEEPQSGIYINNMPGINLESIDKIADQEQTTYKGVWKDVQTQASHKFKVDFISALNKCFKMNRKCDYEDMICDNLEVLSYAWQNLLASTLMVFRLNTNRLNRYTTIDKTQAEELKNYFDAEYSTALEQAIQLVDVSSCCQIECGGNPQRVTWMP